MKDSSRGLRRWIAQSGQPGRRGCAALAVPALVLLVLILSNLACSGSSKKVIYVTATPLRDEQGNPIIPPSMTPNRPTDTPIVPTPNPTRAGPEQGGLYSVQPGDTVGS
ncbi:MAG TPA: hypothetical protein VMT24_06580, partial [Aggregatilineaceae bacterium]|nr:hypothetical protein [Aggregatilineaceae bacterium]